MIYQIDIQEKFDKLIQTKFSELKPINKWNQTMWHKDGSVIVSLVHLSKKSKFCFFNNPNLEVGKVQRWGSTIYSQNLEVSQNEHVDWEFVSKQITNTILL